MRPISLVMEGFTSFREKTSIDFSGLDLFAITGPTGAGKTSIIDAMTYVLYGCTPRIGEKQIAELISQGMSRVAVMLAFSSGSDQFRISRTGRWTGKTMITELRLEQRADDQWILLADSVNRAKPRVEQIIGLDFDGFTKSVVLPQGRFDEFLRGRSDERRRILSDLLDLDIYARMMKRANQIADHHKHGASILEGLLKGDFADATPSNIDQIQLQIDETEPRLKGVDAEIEQLKRFLPAAHGLQQARSDLLRHEADLHALVPKRKQAADDLQRVRQRIEALERKIAEINSRLKLNTYDSGLHVRLSGAREKAQRLDGLLSHIGQLEEAHKKALVNLGRDKAEEKRLEDAAKGAGTQLKAAQKELEKQRKAFVTLQKQYGSPDAITAAIDNLRQLTKQKALLGNRESEVKAKADEKNKLDKKLAVTEKEVEKARVEFEQARTDQESLSRAHSADELRLSLRPGEECPVCEQTVVKVPKKPKIASLEGARRLHADAEKGYRLLQKKVTDLQGQSRSLDTEIKMLNRQTADLVETVHDLTSRLRSFSGTAEPSSNDVAKLISLKKQFEAAQESAGQASTRCDAAGMAGSKASKALTEHRYKVGLLEKEIAGTEREVTVPRKEAESLVKELGELADVKKARGEFEKQEQARLERERLNADRDTQTAELSKTKDHVADANGRLEAIDGTRRKVEETIDTLQVDILDKAASLKAEFPDLKPTAERDERSELDRRARDKQSQRDSLQKTAIQLQSQLKVLEKKLIRAESMRQELVNHRQKHATARTLANALHGDEFIAFIQEEAYRRLAHDGSIHLKTLTSDRFSFGFAGDEFHVVDNWNANEPRPVSTLSGGESFLASLALALALAEGLSGLTSGHTKFALESLFLDEGFGTLDPGTLEFVIAGIEGLSTNERLIGIISHIPDLADRLPTRINVRKSVGGSSIEIS